MKSRNPVPPLRFLSGFFFILGLAFSAQAQDLLWEPAAQITGDSDLITSGKEFDGFLTNSGSDTTSSITADGIPFTVDGIIFNLATDPSNMGFSATDGLISWQITSGDSQRYEYTDFSAPGASSAFDTLMDSGGVYSDGGSATGIVTLSNLMPGYLYDVQVFQWANDKDLGLVTLSGTNTVTLNDGGSMSSLGEFATGSFVATGTMETFDWTGGGSSYTPIGPISVQNLGYVGTPEPSTYVLVLCGMAVLHFLLLRRSQTSAKALADSF